MLQGMKHPTEGIEFTAALRLKPLAEQLCDSHSADDIEFMYAATNEDMLKKVAYPFIGARTLDGYLRKGK